MKPGRNDPCPCGSGKKYKKCCENQGVAKKINATVISSGSEASDLNLTRSISKMFFSKPVSSEAKSLIEKDIKPKS